MEREKVSWRNAKRISSGVEMGCLLGNVSEDNNKGRKKTSRLETKTFAALCFFKFSTFLCHIMYGGMCMCVSK